jgi:hypothetical protein
VEVVDEHADVGAGVFHARERHASAQSQAAWLRPDSSPW